MKKTFFTSSPEETRKLARDLAKGLVPGSTLALFGNLGAGKTCFVQGLAEGLQIESCVSSPTYTLANEYSGKIPLYHIDLYRIQSEDEVISMGLDTYLFGAGITVIEWADRAEELLPANTHRIYLDHIEERPETRRIELCTPLPTETR